MNRCEAHKVGVVVAPYGFVHEPCNATRGLVALEDIHSVVHYACPAFGHRAEIARRFQIVPEAEWDRHLHHTWTSPHDCRLCTRDGERQDVEWYIA